MAAASSSGELVPSRARAPPQLARAPPPFCSAARHDDRLAVSEGVRLNYQRFLLNA